MTDYITKIKEHLARLDPSGSTKAEAAPAGRHRVQVTCEGYEDDPLVLDAPNLMHVLDELPTGCPVGDGMGKGSLWDALHVLASHGLAVAIDYVREHHGDYRERLELADQANGSSGIVDTFIKALKSMAGDVPLEAIFNVELMTTEAREISNEIVARAYNSDEIREVIAFNEKHAAKSSMVRVQVEEAFTARHAAWMKDPA